MEEIIDSPYKVIPKIRKYSTKRQEHFGVICIDDEKRILGMKVLFKGTSHNCPVDTKMVFWYAMSKKASAILLFHNHPSGNALPSKTDEKTTATIIDACKILGLTFFDHIIITRDEYYSFLENDNVIVCKNEQKVAEG